MVEKGKKKEGKGTFKYFYKETEKYIAPVIWSLREGRDLSKEQKNILFLDFRNFEMPLLKSKKVIRKDEKGNDIYRHLWDFLEAINSNDYENIVDSALTVICFHAKGLNRNGEKLNNKQASMEIESNEDDNEDENNEEKSGIKKLDEAFAKCKGKVNFEVWIKKGSFKDSEREAATALEEDLEEWVVENLANEIATEISKILVRDTEVMHVSDQKDDDGFEVEDEWGNLYEHMEKPDENLLEDFEGKEFCKRFSSDMMDKLFDFIEKKDGRAGEIKRFYKRDCRYKNQKQPGQSKKDKDWVESILANKLLEEEGEHAINLVLFFTWDKVKARTEKDDSRYTLEKYVEYIVERNVETTVNKESYNAVKIFRKIIGLFKEKVLDEKQKAGVSELESDEFDNDYEELGVPELKELYEDRLEFFYIALAREFEERCPDILKKPEILFS